MSVPRFHVPSVGPGLIDLPENARVHAVRVLRLVQGDALRVFDGGLEYPATIVEVDKRQVRIEVGAAIRAMPERRVPLHLIMSPLKGDLTELVIQKATELGASRISPAVFERTDTVARREPTDARRERWHRVAVSAAEQCGRATVPRLDDVLALRDLVASLGNPGEHEARIVAAEPSIETPAAPVKERTTVDSVAVAVGPSGGLSLKDLAVLQAAGFSPARLALHTLRAETACIAAIAILGERFS